MPVFPLAYVPKDFALDKNGKLPNNSGWGAPRAAGYPIHAAVDIGAPAGTPIRAVDWGVVMELSGSGFYAGTGVIGINHPMFIARYAEIKPAKGLVIGTSVMQGQVIGEIIAANNKDRTQMLHFEMFNGTERGSLTDRSVKPHERRKDVIDPTPFVMAWADELKAHQAEVTELTDNAPAKFTWLGALQKTHSLEEVRQATKAAGFKQHSVKIDARIMPVPDFVYHPRFGKLPNPEKQRTQVNEYWSKQVDKGYAIIRLSLALGGWMHFKEWVLAKHWDAYMNASADHAHVALYKDSGELLTVAAVEAMGRA